MHKIYFHFLQKNKVYFFFLIKKKKGLDPRTNSFFKNPNHTIKKRKRKKTKPTSFYRPEINTPKRRNPAFNVFLEIVGFFQD
jgi:hypothetical protein